MEFRNGEKRKIIPDKTMKIQVGPFCSLNL